LANGHLEQRAPVGVMMNKPGKKLLAGMRAYGVMDR
jgi:hypothetical protein